MVPKPVELPDHKTVFLASAWASAVAVGMVVVRALYSGYLTYAFLTWNLFLAWIPWVFSWLAYRAYRKSSRVNLLVVLYGSAWLLFFPNAPYILTDFLHLQERAPVPLWFDLLLIFSFAWAGLFLGFNSLFSMQELVREKRGPLVGWLFALAVLAVSSFGIYLGRFLGWNSWDVLVDPRGLAADVLGRLAHPLAYPRTLAVSFLLTVVLASMYLALFALTRLPRRGEG
jgi:uncharacterized membrane protein